MVWISSEVLSDLERRLSNYIGETHGNRCQLRKLTRDFERMEWRMGGESRSAYIVSQLARSGDRVRVRAGGYADPLEPRLDFVGIWLGSCWVYDLAADERVEIPPHYTVTYIKKEPTDGRATLKR